MPTDEQVFEALKASLEERPVDGAAESTDDGESRVCSIDPALRRVIVPIEGEERSYPILTAYEMERCQYASAANGDVRGGLIMMYISWLAQRRTPGHAGRVFDASMGRVSERRVKRMLGAGWWHRLMNRLTGRRTYDGYDSTGILVALAAVNQWNKKKQASMIEKSRLSP